MQMKPKEQGAGLFCLLQHPVLVLSWGSLHVFGRRANEMGGTQASLSPQVGLPPTEMFGIEDHQGRSFCLSEGRTTNVWIPSSTCALRQASPGQGVASPWLCPVSWHILVSLLLCMLLAGCRALVIKSADLHRASTN